MTYRVRMAFRADPDGEGMPEVVASADEYTLDAHGLDIVDCPIESMPEFYRTDVEKSGPLHEVRELIAHVPDSAVDRLFRTPETVATADVIAPGSRSAGAEFLNLLAGTAPDGSEVIDDGSWAEGDVVDWRAINHKAATEGMQATHGEDGEPLWPALLRQTDERSEA